MQILTISPKMTTIIDLKHRLLESRIGNFNITVKNEITDALISERIDEIFYLSSKRKVCYSAIDIGTLQYKAFTFSGPNLG